MVLWYKYKWLFVNFFKKKVSNKIPIWLPPPTNRIKWCYKYDSYEKFYEVKAPWSFQLKL
jgi:hypothetical protein